MNHMWSSSHLMLTVSLIASATLMGCGSSDPASPNNDPGPGGGAALIQLTNHSAPDEQPAWSPDGATVAFTSTRSGNEDIWLMPASGGATVQLTTSTNQDLAATWSPDGNDIGYISRAQTAQVFLMTAPRSGGTPIEVSGGANYRDSNTTLRWSPDGSRFLNSTTAASFISYPQGIKTTVPGIAVGDAVWTPDGQSIVYWGGSQGLFVMSVAGGSGANIPNSAGGIYPDVSPDGTKVAFTARFDTGNWDIYIMPIGGGTPTRVTTHAGEDKRPFWSPDGKRIAFQSFRSGNWDIWTISVP